MAAKLLHTLADDNPDLQNQIGCISGIFQIFERHQIGRHPHKRLLLPPPGNSQFGTAADSSHAHIRETTMERIANRYTNDKRLSAEASRPSFSSSSRSSSFSSLDCGRLGHPDPSSLDRIIFPDTPSSDPVMSQPSPRRLSLDLRDVVKDSMHRESRGSSVQSVAREDGMGQPSKPRGSPRPLQLSKSMDGSLGSTLNRPSDLKESLSALAKLREAPRHNNAEKQHARVLYETKDRTPLSASRDAPRYSYDGREMNRSSFEPRDFSKSNQRLNDLPRLSLDSRETSMRTSSYESNLAHLSADTQTGDGISNGYISNTKQLSRPPSVVAKLMGLDTLPDDKPCRDGQYGSTISLENCHNHSMPSKRPDIRPVRLPVSPRSSRKEPTSPRWKNAEMRPLSSSKCSNEPAPWKHNEGGRTSQQQAARRIISPESTSKSSPSVYSEIEKRLKDLEFKQSGKDLRALKQILEAMQAKGLLGMSKEEPNSNIGTKREEEQTYTGPSMYSGFISPTESHRNHAGPSAPRRANSDKAYDSPIVIMKPAKLVQKSGIPTSSLIPIEGLPDLGSLGRDIARHGKLDSANRRPSKDQSSKESQRENTAKSSTDRKANRSLRETQNSSRAQRACNDNSTSSTKNLGTTSPRLQKKLELDKRSRPPTDSGKSRRQSNRQPTEAGGSPGGRRRLKPNNLQQNTDHAIEVSSELRNISSTGDDISVHSGVASLESKRDVEVTSNEAAECQILPVESLKYPDASGVKMSSSTRPSVVDLVEKLSAIAPEHPSPVSVLDDSAYRENSPPPVKHPTHDLEGTGTKTIEQDNGEGRWNPSEELSANHDDRSGFSSEINRNKLQSIDNLIQKLRRLNSNHDEVRTDYIASLCENSNPDHRYVSEILLASGLLLRDLSSGLATFKLHPSGHPINPELFLVLEQTKSSSLLCKTGCSPSDRVSEEKFHRKLTFDAVNEVLGEKLSSLGQVAEPWLKPTKLVRKTLNAQKLLPELCAEIDQLNARREQQLCLDEVDDPLKTVLWEDVMHRSSDSWTDFHGDISGIILDVERSIFKELVDEVVIGEATASMRRKPSSSSSSSSNRRRRQLFSK